MAFITDRKADDYPTLRDSEDRPQLLADAGRVYAYVRRNELITEAKLRVYGERNDITPDRMSAALGFLRDSNQMFEMPDDSPIASDES